QKNASQAVYQQVIHSSIFVRSRHIAFYMAIHHEINPKLILEKAMQSQKICYMPLLNPHQENTLCFIEYHPKDNLVKNRYGILEPEFKESAVVDPQILDLVFFPLVAFDNYGHRVGMGAGYYDRTFAFVKNNSLSKPLLMGLAYDWQCVDDLVPNPWDVPLHAIATNKKLILVNS
ncbi:MAG: 5-formyltetrahydrofolate cyclo-ligase, partial [Proteobacteria bacterium]|nr:5-formyltetrahydrofolate cyclo-ligase [Pseudomonadota bacterium]